MCLYLVIVLFRRHNGKALIMSVKFIPDSFLYSYIIYQISKFYGYSVILKIHFTVVLIILVSQLLNMAPFAS